MLRVRDKSEPQQVYRRLLSKEMQLAAYLKYLRVKQPASHYVLDRSRPAVHAAVSRPKPQTTEIPHYVRAYLQQLKEVGEIENSMGKKIYKKIIQYLAQFPVMGFLMEEVLSGDNRRLCLSESTLLGYAVDSMVPLFEKILEKIEMLKKEAESKKLMELGHRIKHLQYMVNHTKISNTQSVFPPFEPDRVEKYLIMEDNIAHAEKKYGRFSLNFNKNKEVFCNLNNVYAQICDTKQ